MSRRLDDTDLQNLLDAAYGGTVHAVDVVRLVEEVKWYRSQLVCRIDPVTAPVGLWSEGTNPDPTIKASFANAMMQIEKDCERVEVHDDINVFPQVSGFERKIVLTDKGLVEATYTETDPPAVYGPSPLREMYALYEQYKHDVEAIRNLAGFLPPGSDSLVTEDPQPTIVEGKPSVHGWSVGKTENPVILRAIRNIQAAEGKLYSGWELVLSEEDARIISSSEEVYTYCARGGFSNTVGQGFHEPSNFPKILYGVRTQIADGAVPGKGLMIHPERTPVVIEFYQGK